MKIFRPDKGRKLLVEIPGGLKNVLMSSVRTLLIWMQSRVRTGYLSGQVLNRRSGTLSRAIRYAVESDKKTVDGALFVGKEAWYGKLHEYGGIFEVPSHLRVITKAFGKELANPVMVIVKPYFMAVPERAFMRPVLGEAQPKWYNAVVRGIREYFQTKSAMEKGMFG